MRDELAKGNKWLDILRPATSAKLVHKVNEGLGSFDEHWQSPDAAKQLTLVAGMAIAL
jgi:hypothetical protein